MNFLTALCKRLIFATLWLAAFSATLWALFHRDEVFDYLSAAPSAFKKILMAVVVVAISAGVIYAGWRNLIRRSFACSKCGGSGQLVRINHRNNTEKVETCYGCNGHGQVFGFVRRAIAFLAVGLGFVVGLLVLNLVLDGALGFR